MLRLGLLVLGPKRLHTMLAHVALTRFWRAFVPVITPLKVGKISVGIQGPRCRKARSGSSGEFHVDMKSDRLCHFVLQGKQVVKRAIIVCRPDMSLILYAHQLGGDACAVIHSTQATLNHIANA